MASVYSKNLEVFTAKQFRESLSRDGGANVYLTFGRPAPWTNETAPPQANTSVAAVDEIWKNMIGGKRILSNDVRHGLKRHNWTANTVYIAYDHMANSLDLKNANSAFYVLTDEFNVYKCLSNNYGKVSTYKPTSTNPSGHFQTADKYIWKYMFTLTGEEQERFLTADYMPVKTLLTDDNSLQWQVQDNALDGALHHIQVLTNGTGYTSNNISVIINGDGRFANAYATRSLSNTNVANVTIDNKGSGYTYADISFKSTHGAGATARAIISPPNGHGSDPLIELGGSYLIINVKIDGSEGGVITTENDFRQISIIQDPRNYYDDRTLSNAAFSQITKITLAQSSTGSGYVEDEIAYQGTSLANATFRGTVAGWDSGNSIVSLTNTEGNPTSQLLIGNTSTAARYVSSVSYPDAKRYTGHLLYTDNITTIARAEDQSEDFKIVLSF